MVICPEHKYVYVEIPQTGCSAVSAELCQSYGGKKILRKHATYFDFLSQASPEERRYFAFGNVRNPLDVAVSLYFKIKTNHKNIYTDPKGATSGAVQAFGQQFKFVQETNADFPTFFKTFKKAIFNDYYTLGHESFGFIIRFENLAADFETALRKIGLAPVRPLPLVNKTQGKDADFWSYYTPEIRRQACRVYGPFMRKWGYEFPPEWGTDRVPWLSTVRFKTADWAAEFAARRLGITPNNLGPLQPAREIIRRVWA